MLIIIHILRNRKREEWKNWWRTKTSLKPPQVMTSLLGLLSQALLSIVSYPVKAIRRAVKFTCLDIFNCFIQDTKDTLLQDESYNQVIEDCVNFMVKFLDEDNKDAEYREKLFFPAFMKFLQLFIGKISKDDNDPRWKWCVGTLLRFVEFPIKNHQSQMLINCFNILLQPFEERAKQLQFEPFKLIPDSEDNIIIDKGQIKGATLDKLIERITSEQDLDPKIREVFFLTYRSFTKPFILLEKLLQRYRLTIEVENESSDKITLRVISAIKLWIDKHFYDFDNILITKLIKFLDEEAAYVAKILVFCKNVKKSLNAKLSRSEEKAASSIMFSKKPPKPLIPRNFNRYVQFSLLDWNSIEFARQMTLIEYDYFKKIEPKECLSGGAWAKDKKYILAPNIAALTDRWNMMTTWVSQTVLSCDDMKQRRQYMIKFIEIAGALRELNNFNGVTEMLSGLNNNSVHRLKKTWEALPQEVLNSFHELQQICDQQNASKNMREALARAPPPCIPPLSMYLKDLIFIEDGNPDQIRGLINVFKRRQLSKIILEIKQYQQTPYHLERVPYLYEVLNHKLFPANPMSDDDMWERSLKIEPRSQN
jgi:son of sevenless-like protein